MPFYTYQCPTGHRWDEVRSIHGSETSQDPCPTCVEGLPEPGPEDEEPDWSQFHGRRVPPDTPPSVKFVGAGWTPKHYPNRSGK